MEEGPPCVRVTSPRLLASAQPRLQVQPRSEGPGLGLQYVNVQGGHQGTSRAEKKRAAGQDSSPVTQEEAGAATLAWEETWGTVL